MKLLLVLLAVASVACTTQKRSTTTTSQPLTSTSAKASEPLPIVISFKLNNIATPEGYDMVAEYMASKQHRTINMQEVQAMATAATQKRLATYQKEDFEKKLTDGFEKTMNKQVRQWETLAKELRVNMLATKDSVQAVHIVVNNLPLKLLLVNSNFQAADKPRTLSLTNTNKLSGRELLNAALDSCFALKMFK